MGITNLTKVSKNLNFNMLPADDELMQYDKIEIPTTYSQRISQTSFLVIKK